MHFNGIIAFQWVDCICRGAGVTDRAGDLCSPARAARAASPACRASGSGMELPAGATGACLVCQDRPGRRSGLPPAPARPVLLQGEVPAPGTRQKSAFGPVQTAHPSQQASCPAREFLIFVQTFIILCMKPNLVCNFGTITKMGISAAELRSSGHFSLSP